MKLAHSYLVFIILWMGSLNADPYRFIRLLKWHGNTLDKTVDLIYEIHETLSSPATKGSHRTKKLSSQKERELFSPPARGLINTLRTMADKRTTEPTALLWELDDYAIKNRELYKDTFLFFMGKQFSIEFSTDKKKNIIFVDADNYRRGKQQNNPTDLFSRHEKKGLIGDLIAPLENIIDPTHSPAVQDLTAAKQHINASTYKKLEKLWQNGSRMFKEIYDRLNANRDRTIPQFLATLSHDEKETMRDALISNMADLELLLKIFAAPQKHVIIYAGGDHCEQVADWLSENFDFKVAIDLGLTQYQIRSSYEELFIPLDPNIFNHLAVDPVITWNSFKNIDFDNPPTMKLPLYTRLNKSTIDSLLENPNELKKTIQQYRKVLVDIPNIHIQPDKTPFLNYALLNNNFQAAELLIAHGAKPTVDALFIAMKKRKPELVRTLLKHGAQPNDRIYRETKKIGGEIERIFSEYRAAKKPNYKDALDE